MVEKNKMFQLFANFVHVHPLRSVYFAVHASVCIFSYQ